MPGARKQPVIESPYDRDLAGVLSFRSFSQAEETLITLENLRRRYLAEGDAEGVAHCRRVALLGRRRAEAIARNSRVVTPKRRQKAEIALWFRIWLETPELFIDWLALRKSTEAFRILPGAEELFTE
jgi:hypothetical protein